MPIYEYRCAACGFQKEYLQKISDAPLKDCPECGKSSLGKMVTAAGFQLKGSGWYATDFKHPAKSKTDVTSKSDAATKSDDKPAAKADDKPSAKSDTSSTATSQPAATKSDTSTKPAASTNGAGST